MVLNTTFNNISVISWWSVLLVEETEVPGENHRSFASHWQSLSDNVVVKYTSPVLCYTCYVLGYGSEVEHMYVWSWSYWV